MILPLHHAIRARIASTVASLYGLDPAGLPTIVIEYPPRRHLGDLAVPLAFELARRLRKAPRAIAQEIASALGPIDGVERAEPAANGYVNLYLRRPQFLINGLVDGARTRAPESAASTQVQPKTIVEHTAINPNKAAHVGHLRNATLGDTLGRLLRFQGVTVEIQNYIDDTGVQVADVVVGFRELEGMDLEGVRLLADSPRFDYYCWDLYARVTSWYEADRERLKIRAATLHEIEHGHNPAAAIGSLIADRIVRRHLETMARMNVDYQLLTWEGDILRLQFWSRAFEILKHEGAVFLQTQGRLAGCWVMRIEDEPEPGEPPTDAASEEGDEESAEQREKVIVRSDGTVTYVGKDIANQLWKFGLLGLDFHYRVFTRRSDGSILWATSATPVPTAANEPVPEFGRAGRTYNVIDVRQAYLQKLLKQALAALGHTREADQSIHFAYEMVALSPATARELGHESADEGRSFVEVSGRKGLGVKADDLLDRLVEKAAAEVATRNADVPDPERQRIAASIAIAALRYFMIKYSRGKVIAFDIDEALSFEGESGPYLQYALVRANNIFHKLYERDGIEESDLQRDLVETPPDAITQGDESDDLWGLVLEAARLDEVVEQAVRTLELSILAKYAFGLAQNFNAIYHRYSVLNEERPDVRRWRAAVVSYFRRQLTQAVELMGFGVPPRM